MFINRAAMNKNVEVGTLLWSNFVATFYMRLILHYPKNGVQFIHAESWFMIQPLDPSLWFSNSAALPAFI
jgi:hypothetical protein